MNPRLRALGETVLRVKDLQRVKSFYVDVIGLDVLREFEGMAFLKVSNGYGGHTQIIGLFHESLPAPVPKDPREPVHLESTSLHHFAIEITGAGQRTAIGTVSGASTGRSQAIMAPSRMPRLVLLVATAMEASVFVGVGFIWVHPGAIH